MNHTLAAEPLHFAWDNSIAPRLEIDAGETVTFGTWDAGGHFYTRESTAEDAERRASQPIRGHALTGPVAIRGAQPGQTLVIDILDVAPNDWGYTAFGPGRGLLPDDFS